MELQMTVKQAGKKQAMLTRKSICLPLEAGEHRVQVLLQQLVRQQVEAFHIRRSKQEKGEFWLLSDATSGPGKFGGTPAPESGQIEVEQAIQTTELAFRDGLFAMFHHETRLESLEESILISDGDHLTFIRLTFLAGGYW